MMAEKSEETKWYFKFFWVVAALVSVGPLALPLVWFHPRYSRKTKTIVTFATLILSWYIGILLMHSLKVLKEYYGLVFQNGL
jgi:4-amino-4-deoxy-L-arabinose transferase-like glycosyltransferase